MRAWIQRLFPACFLIIFRNTVVSWNVEFFLKLGLQFAIEIDLVLVLNIRGVEFQNCDDAMYAIVGARISWCWSWTYICLVVLIVESCVTQCGRMHVEDSCICVVLLLTHLLLLRFKISSLWWRWTMCVWAERLHDVRCMMSTWVLIDEIDVEWRCNVNAGMMSCTVV